MNVEPPDGSLDHVRLPGSASGVVPAKVYWCDCGPRHGNFGDKLTPLLLDHLGIPYSRSRRGEAELFGVGSITHKIPSGFGGIVWTTGNLYADQRNDFRAADVLALRGHLTLERSACRAPDSIALGDGGLLCDLLFERPSARACEIGVVPHYADFDRTVVQEIRRASPRVTLIDICGPIPEVVRQVGECEAILSSSLHGLVLADSFDIPNRWVAFGTSTAQILGNGFKFHDYYSVFGIELPHPAILSGSESPEELAALARDYDRPGIESVKRRLRETLSALRSFLER